MGVVYFSIIPTFEPSRYYKCWIVCFYYRNLLGGLYRENPVKSRNYEAVKSSKKWENVGNSYIIPIFERQIQVILFFLFQFLAIQILWLYTPFR